MQITIKLPTLSLSAIKDSIQDIQLARQAKAELAKERQALVDERVAELKAKAEFNIFESNASAVAERVKARRQAKSA